VDDRYSNFADLSAQEVRGTDFEVYAQDRKSEVAVIAPHGGFIEPGTSEIARAIAGEDYSLYLFEGLVQGRPHSDLHITSHRFDEPKALELVGGAQTAVALHGRQDRNDSATVLLGGRNVPLRDAIAESLVDAGFVVGFAAQTMAARDPDNICNRGAAGAGVQLELPLTLRKTLVAHEDRLQSFVRAVRKAIAAAPLRD
jgi:phage replication-related protein YjqB (UPF0714/DUF867 family)